MTFFSGTLGRFLATVEENVVKPLFDEVIGDDDLQEEDPDASGNVEYVKD
jgi:hypothetical protein